MRKIPTRKISAKIGSLIMVLVVAISSMSMSAMAANTTNTSFSFTLNLVGYTRNSEVRTKTNTSAVYFYWTGTTGTSDSVNVRILAGSSASTATTNRTCLKDGTAIDHVVCTMGTEYSIHSLAYENNTPNVRFSLRTGGTATVSGVWSPDSSKTYTHATN